MPQRKYKDILHLSSTEYRIEAEKRRSVERKEYRHAKYLANKDKILDENKKKRLGSRIVSTREKLQRLLDSVPADTTKWTCYNNAVSLM